MPAEKSYARLGLFVVIGVLVILATGLFFVQRLRSRQVISLVTYTTENVSGLDISSPVRYRGVAVGRVADLRIDAAGRTIEIDFELFRDRLSTLGASPERLQAQADSGVLSRMGVQVISNPVTGEAYLLLDIPETPPTPLELGFTPSRPYIPSMPTPLSTLEDRVPAVLQRAEATLRTLEAIVARVPGSLDRSDSFFTSVEQIMRESRLPELSADLRAFSTSTTGQMAQITANMARITSDIERVTGSESALVKMAEEARAALRDADVAASRQAARDAADRTSLAADDLRRSLPAIRDALEQLRDLARQIEEQPESLVYGPRQPKSSDR